MFRAVPRRAVHRVIAFNRRRFFASDIGGALPTHAADSLIGELNSASLVHQCTALDDELASLLAAPRSQVDREAAARTGVYLGIDPTASALHLGNLMPLATLLRCRWRGFQTVVVLGGFTALIGDPSGRSSERVLLDETEVQRNKENIERTVRKIMSNGDGPETLIFDNREWYDEMSALALLRDVGKRFGMSSMLARESVRARLDGDGLSFTEFTYQLLQARDFEELRRRANVRVQLGGSDQYGNICAGIDYVRRVSRTRVAGLTQPLLLTAAGAKFGKSAGNADRAWLDAARTAPFALYQHLLQLPDADAAAALPRLAPRADAAAALAAHAAAPERRAAQRALAADVVALVHGDAVRRAVERATALLYGDAAAVSDADARQADRELLDVLDTLPTNTVSRTKAFDEPLFSVLADCGAVASRKQARTLITGGGCYINGRRESDAMYRLQPQDLLPGSQHIVLRLGKKSNVVLKLT